MPVSDITTTTVISPSSSPISMATDFENEINHSSHTSSALTVTPSVGSTSSASQELPTNETTLNPEGASAPNSSSIPIVPSIIGGCIFALLHIIILVIVIYLCYRAKSGQKSDAAKVESVVNNPSMTSETDQPTAGYESIYAQAVPTNTQLCTNTNAEPIEDTDQYTYYESSNYTLPIDIHGVVLDRNPAYGCHDQFELEDPYASNSINKGLDKMNSYTKILPPTP